MSDKNYIMEEEDLERKSCPCYHTTPCHEFCTCIHIVSSRGCRRCCSVGNMEQRKAKAEWLAKIIDEAYDKL